MKVREVGTPKSKREVRGRRSYSMRRSQMATGLTSIAPSPSATAATTTTTTSRAHQQITDHNSNNSNNEVRWFVVRSMLGSRLSSTTPQVMHPFLVSRVVTLPFGCLPGVVDWTLTNTNISHICSVWYRYFFPFCLPFYRPSFVLSPSF